MKSEIWRTISAQADDLLMMDSLQNFPLPLNRIVIITVAVPLIWVRNKTRIIEFSTKLVKTTNAHPPQVPTNYSTLIRHRLGFELLTKIALYWSEQLVYTVAFGLYHSELVNLIVVVLCLIKWRIKNKGGPVFQKILKSWLPTSLKKYLGYKTNIPNVLIDFEHV